MLHCSRTRKHRRLADCIHSTAGSPVPLSDNIPLGEVSSKDIREVILINSRLKELKLPFYAVCGRGGNPSFRRIGESCTDEKNIAYLSKSDLSKRLQKHYGFSLEALRFNDLNTLRKKVEEKQKEHKEQKEQKEQKTRGTRKDRETNQTKVRTERLRRKRAKATPDHCPDCEVSETTQTQVLPRIQPKTEQPKVEQPKAEQPKTEQPKAPGKDKEAQAEDKIARLEQLLLASTKQAA